MNKIEEFILKSIRKLYLLVFHRECKTSLVENDPDIASEMIYDLLSADKPCMVARYGGFELSTVVNYLGVKNRKPSILKYILGKQQQWWWNKNLMQSMQNNAGFFPPTEEKLSQFCEMMLRDSKEVDLIGSWLEDENIILKERETIKKVKLVYLEPYWSKKPWSRVLEGKKVLVVHPFSDDIIAQYNNHREQLFENKSVLPKFASLRVVKAVQSLGGDSHGFKDWFEALEWMKQEMDKEPYDIALIGCGAYGFPLAAHSKRTGHKAIHLGGALQLLFGIRGKRWEDPNYGVKVWGLPYGFYINLMNDYWVRPGSDLKPLKAQDVEGACYW